MSYWHELPFDSPHREAIENRHKVGNATWAQIMTGDNPPPICNNCRYRHLTAITKENLLKFYTSVVDDCPDKERKEGYQERVDRMSEELRDGVTYMWCEKCGWIQQYDINTEPIDDMKRMKAVTCTKHRPFAKTMTLKLMHENPDDEKKVLRLGEPQALSEKKWYWTCSACPNRVLLYPSQLQKTYKPMGQVIGDMFIKSADSRKKKKAGIGKENEEDLKGYLGYVPEGATVVDERSYEYYQ